MGASDSALKTTVSRAPKSPVEDVALCSLTTSKRSPSRRRSRYATPPVGRRRPTARSRAHGHGDESLQQFDTKRTEKRNERSVRFCRGGQNMKRNSHAAAAAT
jgi:hypothetical protein